MPRKRRKPKHYLKIPKGKENFYICWSTNRRTQRLSTGTSDEKAAARILADFTTNTQIIENELLSTGDLIEDYKEYKKMQYTATNAPKENYANVVYSLKPIEDYFEDFDPKSLSRRLIREFVKYRRTFKDSNAKIRNQLTYFRAALNHAKKDKIIAEVPHFDIPPRHPARDKILTPKEMKKLVGSCLHPHLRLYVLLSRDTLARKGAILGLKWSEVNLDTGLVDYNPPGRVVTSNKRRVAVPVAGDTLKELIHARKYALTDYVIEYNSKPIHDIKRTFNNATDDAGLPWVTPHLIRHTGASLLAAAGTSLEKLSELTGDTIETIKKNYLHLTPEYLKDATNDLRDIYK